LQEVFDMSRTVVGYRGAGPFDLPSFVIAYQPIVDVVGRSIVAYEALTRGVNGSSYPQLTAHLNAAALRAFHRRTADRAIRRAAELGLLDLQASLSLNLQPDLHPDALDAAFVAGVARSCGLNPGNILLEFTEDHRLPIPEYKQLLERNKQAGFATGMDDFGAGYSGLSALVECRPEVLKLDRALVKGIDTCDTRQKIVQAFANCSKALDMRLIAEGIETRAECEMLLALGITHMQGYLFSKPVVDTLPTHSVWGVDPVHVPADPDCHPSFLSSLDFEAAAPVLTLQA
jgi:EAL domain-containing protein (putative c-di-GMP-specific phosphodiesterase class I)